MSTIYTTIVYMEDIYMWRWEVRVEDRQVRAPATGAARIDKYELLQQVLRG
jgi:hypothetical protein